MNTPNVLLIMTDQLRGDCIGCNDNELIKTPNIDRIAKKGVNFTEAYSTTPVCIPARHILLTGKYGHSIDALQNRKDINPDIPTFVNLLTNSGYFTQAIGKMHFFPERSHHGFQRMLLSEEIPHYKQDDDYLMYLQNKGYDIEELHGMRHEKYYHPQIAEIPEEDLAESWVGDRTTEFIKQNRNRPFFCFASFIHPHPPWALPEKYANFYNTDEMPMPKRNECDREINKDTIQKRSGMSNLDNEDEHLIKKIKSYYYGSVTLVDKNVGKMLDALEENNLKDNTIVIFVSDHGESLGDHYLWGKSNFYEGAAKIPFIVSWPGHFPEGEKRKQLVSLCDLMPMILKNTGIKVPEYCQGKDITPAIMDSKFEFRNYLIGEVNNTQRDAEIMVRFNDWKYVYSTNGGIEKLYNLKEDPFELNNLADSNRELCKDCRNRLISYYKGEKFNKLLDGDNLIKYPLEIAERRVNSQYPHWPHNDPDMNGPERKTSKPE